MGTGFGAEQIEHTAGLAQVGARGTPVAIPTLHTQSLLWRSTERYVAGGHEHQATEGGEAALTQVERFSDRIHRVTSFLL